MSDLKRLVDYGTDTEEEISSDSDDSSLKEDSSSIKPEKKPTNKLIGAATVLLTGIKTETVLQNPYQVAEAAKFKQLEQHVKMVDTKNVKRLNGKKICFSFQKGKCRFGTNCLYAHDEIATDSTQKSEVRPAESDKKNNSKRPANKQKGPAPPFNKRAK